MNSLSNLLLSPMAGHDPLNLLFIGAVFILAGLVKGVTGMGLPTVAVGLLSLTMTPMQAAALLLLPSFFTNAWQLLTGPSLTGLGSRLWPMMAGICVGTGAGALLQWHAGWAAGALGLALVGYAVLGLGSIRFSVPAGRERWLGPLVGAITGVVTAATGVFVIPAVPYLQALKLEKETLVQAMGLAFTVSTVALGAGLLADDALPPAALGASLMALIPALAGMLLGQRLRARMPEQLFKRCFLIGLLLLGLHMALSAT